MRTHSRTSAIGSHSAQNKRSSTASHPSQDERAVERTPSETGTRTPKRTFTVPGRVLGRLRFQPPHPRRHPPRGLLARRWPVHVHLEGWPALLGEGLAGVRPRRWLRPHALALGRGTQVALPPSQPARGRGALRQGLHGTGSGLHPSWDDPAREAC